MNDTENCKQMDSSCGQRQARPTEAHKNGSSFGKQTKQIAGRASNLRARLFHLFQKNNQEWQPRDNRSTTSVGYTPMRQKTTQEVEPSRLT